MRSHSFRFVAKALGLGVERAALTSYEIFEKYLKERESIAETILENPDNPEDGNFAMYKLLPIQYLDDIYGECIEVDVTASDATVELTATYCARKNPNILELRKRSGDPDD